MPGRLLDRTITLMDFETTIVWFRKDLRLHDNAALLEASEADRVVPVYVFDPRTFGEAEYGGRRSFGFQKTGPVRARFLIESVADLRGRLRARGSDLLVRQGRPEDLLPDLADAVDADAVFFQELPTIEEREIRGAVERRLRERDVLPQKFWTHTLYHVNDLPNAGREIPDTFTPFKDQVEANLEIRDSQDVPSLPDPGLEPTTDSDEDFETATDDGDALETTADSRDSGSGDLATLESGPIPSVATLDPDLEPPDSEDRAVLPFEGGETRALERLEEYVWERDCLREYRETRNGLLGADYSSKLSPWLNLGCLSPRRVHEAVRAYERDRVANDSTYWLVFELTWRDFFQFQFLKHGAKPFTLEGIRERTDVEWSVDESAFRRWRQGRTGVPFVDANVRELNATGYMSNRGRQNVASFLANDLRIDWRRGAAYFETRLVDYDPASNYGNWAYVAGVGNDSRNRSFDVIAQARRYDAEGEYVKTWCPELSELPPDRVHEPWTLDGDEQAAYGVELGVDYPEPVARP